MRSPIQAYAQYEALCNYAHVHIYIRIYANIHIYMHDCVTLMLLCKPNLFLKFWIVNE